jgi:hypothetical protein
MILRRSLSVVPWVVALVAAQASLAAAQDRCPPQPIAPGARPVLCGTTSSTVGSGAPTDMYAPLEGVQVTVYRMAPVGRGDSKNGGNFFADFPPGSPVYALFKGPNNQLPALQQLKAQAGTMHTVHVALLTPEQARNQGINPHLYLQSIIEQLRSLGVSSDDRQLQDLSEQLKKIG